MSENDGENRRGCRAWFGFFLNPFVFLSEKDRERLRPGSNISLNDAAPLYEKGRRRMKNGFVLICLLIPLCGGLYLGSELILNPTSIINFSSTNELSSTEDLCPVNLEPGDDILVAYGAGTANEHAVFEHIAFNDVITRNPRDQIVIIQGYEDQDRKVISTAGNTFSNYQTGQELIWESCEALKATATAEARTTATSDAFKYIETRTAIEATVAPEVAVTPEP